MARDKPSGGRKRGASAGHGPDAQAEGSGVRDKKKARKEQEDTGEQLQQVARAAAVAAAAAAAEAAVASAAAVEAAREAEVAAAAAVRAGEKAAAAAGAAATAAAAAATAAATAAAAAAAAAAAVRPEVVAAGGPQQQAGSGCGAGPSSAQGSGPQGRHHSLAATAWRDWVNHPEAVAAIWPRVLTSAMPSASCLALLSTCQCTRNTVLREAPCVKLTLQLERKSGQPASSPLLLLKQSGRAQPTTMALLNSSTGQPSRPPSPALAPDQASTTAKRILTDTLKGCSCITRLNLQGVVVNSGLLKAMRGLPALTHLDVRDAQLPAALTYNAHNLPQGVRTLHLELQSLSEEHAALRSLLTAFLQLNTITNLTLSVERHATPPGTEQRVTDACVAVLDALEAPSLLTRVALPHAWLSNRDIRSLQRAAPLLEELQVCLVSCGPVPLSAENSVAHLEVSWRTLRVHELDLTKCQHLPLGGTQPLDIHVSGFVDLRYGSHGVQAGLTHLTSPQTRPVRLVGTGEDGGTFVWDCAHGVDFAAGLPVLQLSTAPVRRLQLSIRTMMEPEPLRLALQPLTALTQLILMPRSWDCIAVNTLDQLLARLPLHVQRVCMASTDGNAQKKRFTRMVAAVAAVPERQDRPLQLCIMGAKPGAKVWKQVKECHARGDMGVVMEEEEAWGWPA